MIVSLLVIAIPINFVTSDEYFRYSGYEDLISEEASRRYMENGWSALGKADLASRLIYHMANMNLPDTLCRNHSLMYLKSFEEEKLWAVQMHDSSAQSLEGQLAGNIYHMGNFDECLDVDLGPMLGQYCLLELQINLDLGSLILSDNRLSTRVFVGNWTIGKDFDHYSPYITLWDRIKLSPDPSKFRRDIFHWAVCVPSSCEPKEVESALNRELLLIGSETGINVTGHLNPLLCQTKKSIEVPLSKGDIIFSIVIGLLLFLTVGSTVIDYFADQTANENTPMITKLLFCFSARRNLKSLSSGDLAGTGFDAIHGLRLLFMCLAIGGHRFMLNIGGPVMGVKIAEEGYKKIGNMYVMNGMIVVDTFFVYSGCLTAYYLPLELDKRRMNPCMIWVYRFIRLTPVYLTVLVFHTTLLEHLGYGPLWPVTMGLEARRCEAWWWTNVLYLNNYIHAGDMCMFQTWYLAVDTHLFMIAVIIVYFMWKRPKWGYVLFAASTVISLSIPFIITYVNEADALLLLFRSAFKDPVAGDYFQYMYAVTHMRAGPYVVGIATGYLLYILRNVPPQIPMAVRYLGHIVAGIICVSAQFGAYVFYDPSRPYNVLESAAYNALHRTAWGVGMALNIFLLVRGRIDWLHNVLTWAPFVPISRLTYCAYLLHTTTHLYELGTLRTPKDINYYNGFWMYMGDLAFTFGLSLILNLSVEAPFRAIEKSILGRKKQEKDDNTQLEMAQVEKREKD